MKEFKIKSKVSYLNSEWKKLEDFEKENELFFQKRIKKQIETPKDKIKKEKAIEPKSFISINWTFLDYNSYCLKKYSFVTFYESEEEKRTIFRTTKILNAFIEVYLKHKTFENIPPDIYLHIMREYAKAIGFELNGLIAFERIKKLMTESILGIMDLDKMKNEQLSSLNSLELVDNERYSDLYRVRRFSINSKE